MKRYIRTDSKQTNKIPTEQEFIKEQMKDHDVWNMSLETKLALEKRYKKMYRDVFNIN